MNNNYKYGIDILDRYITKHKVSRNSFYRNQNKFLSHYLSSSILTKAKFIDIKIEFTEDHEKCLYLEYSYKDYLENTIMCQSLVLCAPAVGKRESGYIENIRNGKECIEVNYDKNKTSLFIPKFSNDKESYFFFSDAVDSIIQNEMKSICNYKGAKLIKSKPNGPGNFIFKDYQAIFSVLTFPNNHSTIVLVIKGTLSTYTTEIIKVIRKLICYKKKYLVLDFKHVDFVSYTFMESLKSIQNDLSNSSKFHLVNINNGIKEQLEKTGQNVVFEIRESFDYNSIDLYH
jgi:anti-anti-sigma regulatory factor